MKMLSDLWAAWSSAMMSLSVGAYLQALSLPISMLVAWLTFKAASANLRYSLIVADVTEQIKAFADCSTKLAAEIEGHYLGNYKGGFTAAAANESRNLIMAQIKALDGRRAVLNVFLSKKKALELERNFDEWENAALGDRFPITRKNERCTEYDAPVAELRRAQSKFDCYLASLRKLCIEGGKKFSKVIR